MNVKNYETELKKLRERSNSVTQMLTKLKNGEDIDFNVLTGLIALGHSNEISLLQENEELRIQNKHGKDIDDIDVPSFMNKKAGV